MKAERHKENIHTDLFHLRIYLYLLSECCHSIPAARERQGKARSTWALYLVVVLLEQKQQQDATKRVFLIKTTGDQYIFWIDKSREISGVIGFLVLCRVNPEKQKHLLMTRYCRYL